MPKTMCLTWDVPKTACVRSLGCAEASSVWVQDRSSNSELGTRPASEVGSESIQDGVESTAGNITRAQTLAIQSSGQT